MKFSSSSKTPPPAKIMLVDDNKHGLSARKTILEELGYDVAVFTTALGALEQLTKQKFDLVITDYKMPKMNGVEFIKRVREVEPAVPAVLISGFVEALGLSEANTGADVVISKSANEVSHLLRAAARLLKKAPSRKPPAKLQRDLKAKRKSAGTSG